MNRISTLAAVLLLTACGGGGSATPPVEPPPPAAGPYTVAPDVAACQAGSLKDTERQAALARLNQIRARHGLPSVTYDSTSDAAVTAAALIMVANKTLTHSPTADMNCYSAAGNTGASTSNLYLRSGGSTLGVASTVPVDAFLTDDGVPSLGHRRWVLDPFLAKTAFGRVDGSADGSTMTMAAALKVIGGPAANLAGTSVDHVAYPEGDYPASLVKADWYLSFSVLADPLVRGNNGSSHVDFSNATIEVDNGLTTLPVTSVSYNYDGYGLPNILQWKVTGLASNTQYQVRIAPVLVNGEMRSYQYTFRLVP